MQSLGVQAEAVKNHDQIALQRQRETNKTGLLIGCLVVIVLCTAMFSGYVDVALDLIKMIGSAVLGWIGASGYAARRGSKAGNTSSSIGVGDEED